MEGWVSDPSFNRAAASERCSKLYNLQSNGRWLKPESLKLKPPGAMRGVPHPTLKRLNSRYKHAPDGKRPEQADSTPVAHQVQFDLVQRQGTPTSERTHCSQRNQTVDLIRRGACAAARIQKAQAALKHDVLARAEALGLARNRKLN